MKQTELSKALAEEARAAPNFAVGYRTARRYLEFGKAVRTLRKAHGLTQQKLAERTGIDQGDISRIENGVWGQRGVSLATMDRILLEFGYGLEIAIYPVKEPLEIEKWIEGEHVTLQQTGAIQER